MHDALSWADYSWLVIYMERISRPMTTLSRLDTLDSKDYLDRIEFARGSGADALAPSSSLLRNLHRAHMLLVPFENLSIHYDQPIVLDEAALFDKIVRRRRGGFCFELNGLFAWLLRALGFTVTLHSANVARADGTFTADFDHLALQVHDLDGANWLVDVGFGDLFAWPLRLKPAVEQDGGDGHHYRLSRPGARSGSDIGASRDSTSEHWLLQRDGEAGWEPQYRFTLHPYALPDFSERCLYLQTSPESPFTKKRVCTLAVADGRVTLSDLRLIETTRGERKERTLESEDEYLAVLSDRFGVVI
jgi:N-hydroxyarylamine O-acetyltransferase